MGGLNVPRANHRWWMDIENESMTTTKCVVTSPSPMEKDAYLRGRCNWTGAA